MTDVKIAELLNVLQLDGSFDRLKYGGLLEKLNLTFRVPYSTENQEFLLGLLGDNWEDFVETSDETDSGIDKNDFPAEGILVYGDPEVTYYRHYRFHADKFKTLPGESLGEIAAQFISMVTDTEQPCPYDQILIIVAIIVLTLATAGSAGYASNAAYLAYAAAALSIGLQMGVLQGEQAKYAQVALIVLAVYGGINGLMNEGARTGLLTTMHHLFMVTNACIDGMEMYQQLSHDENMKDLQSEYSQEMESLAKDFERAFHFTYETSYDSVYRDGHEREPDRDIKDFYSDFTVYK